MASPSTGMQRKYFFRSPLAYGSVRNRLCTAQFLAQTYLTFYRNNEQGHHVVACMHLQAHMTPPRSNSGCKP